MNYARSLFQTELHARETTRRATQVYIYGESPTALFDYANVHSETNDAELITLVPRTSMIVREYHGGRTRRERASRENKI